MPLVGIYDFSDTFFSFFSVIATFFDVASLFSNSKIVIVIISLYYFPFLNWVIKLTLSWGAVLRMEIPKQCAREKNVFEQ